MSTGEAILWSAPALAALLALWILVSVRRRAVARFIAEQKRRSDLCPHSKHRSECFYCVDGGREDVTDPDFDRPKDGDEEPIEEPAPPIQLPRILPIRFDEPIDYARVEVHTDHTCPPGVIDIGVLWANGVVDHYQLCVTAKTSQVCTMHEEFRRPIKGLFLRLVPGVTRIKVFSAGRQFINSDPQTLALLGGAA